MVKEILKEENVPMVEETPIIKNVSIIEKYIHNWQCFDGWRNTHVENVPMVEEKSIVENVQTIEKIPNCESQKWSKKHYYQLDILWWHYFEHKTNPFQLSIYSIKFMILLKKIPYIKKIKSQIISHVKYSHSKNPQLCIPKTKQNHHTMNEFF